MTEHDTPDTRHAIDEKALSEQQARYDRLHIASLCFAERLKTRAPNKSNEATRFAAAREAVLDADALLVALAGK